MPKSAYCKQVDRRGRSGGAIVVGLFLLSGLLTLPALWWAFREPASSSARQAYVFSDSPPLPATESTTNLQLKIKAWHFVAELPKELAQFETVFWEPDDTNSLREWIAKENRLKGARVLEIGTGTGLVSLCCALRGATALATDINPQAVANAAYNADWLGVSQQLDVRLVPAVDPGPFSVIAAEEKFDFIISNPPWEDGTVTEVAEHALYDPSFALLDGLLQESAEHLRPGGCLLLAYGHRTAIHRILENAPKSGWTVQVLDDRELDRLAENFLPGLLMQLTPDR